HLRLLPVARELTALRRGRISKSSKAGSQRQSSLPRTRRFVACESNSRASKSVEHFYIAIRVICCPTSKANQSPVRSQRFVADEFHEMLTKANVSISTATPVQMFVP